ncbi:reverse transcriptase [Oesophagostomum dentatum]|uniref:Reverse transcriptase n=1 Tax=Oesophagostomum dentatum TaxID=61180 RepID=A0A0B1TFM8_OESDE|nr:reverse transcriptase [Oesophagostomum dentatum]
MKTKTCVLTDPIADAQKKDWIKFASLLSSTPRKGIEVVTVVLPRSDKMYDRNRTEMSEAFEPESAKEAYHEILSINKTASANCWTFPVDPPRISQHTQVLLSNRITLRNDLIPIGRIAYPVACKAARISLREDICRRKTWIVQKAVENRSSLKEAQRKGGYEVKRLLMKDPATGVYSQRATEALVTSYYNELYTSSTAFPLSIPSPSEPCPPFCADEAEYALSQLHLGKSPGPDGLVSEQLALAKSDLAQLLTALLNGIKCGDPIPKHLTSAYVKLLYKKLDLGKSPGPDGLISEQLALAKSDLAQLLTALLNGIKCGDPIPKHLTSAYVKLLYKKNYRPIYLFSAVLKAITRVILTRIEKWLEETESSSQVGFRKNHSTLNHIHVLKQLAEKSVEYKFPVYIALIDFQKAFDAVEWPAVWTALARKGVHAELISMLQRIYTSSSTSIFVNSRLVEVKIRRGVKQGDTLSPKLFNATLQMALDSIDWGTCGQSIGGRKLRTPEYADDVTVLASSRGMLEKMLRLIAEASSKVGLQINSEKTSPLTNRTSTRQPITISGMTFHFMDHVQYLGCRISFPLDQSAEVCQRIQSGWTAFRKLENVPCNRMTPLVLKKRAYDIWVTPAVLHGSETWSLRKSDVERLRVTQRRMERKMLGLTLKDRWSNERIRALTKLRDWSDKATRRKLQWAQKIRNMKEEEWAKAVTTWIPYNYIRRRGRDVHRSNGVTK